MHHATRALVTACLWLAVHTASYAMTLERVGKDLFATGPTVDQDFISFKDALAVGGVERLILVNAPGGDLWTGMRVAHMVKAAGVKTIASGACMSACSLIFMAGQQRAFGTGSKARNTMIGIHGAHDVQTKAVNHQAMPQMYALYKTQMGDKFNHDVINKALYGIEDAQGFLRMRELSRNKPADQVPWFCPKGSSALADCQQHIGQDAFSLGVVTQREVEALTLPASMQPVYGFFGQRLQEPLDPGEGSALVDQLCSGTPLCAGPAQALMTRWLAASHHRAVAVGLGKRGAGWRWELDDPGRAILMALYACNHALNNPKLCRVAAFDDHLTLPLYEQAKQQSEAALAQLPVPQAGAVAEEKAETGSSTPDGYKPGTDLTGMAPRKLNDIRRIHTDELVEMLRQARRPVLIDVNAGGGVIPTALNFWNGGLTLADEKAEAAYDQRFRNMLQAAVPDKSQPVVFYCVGSNWWYSVNAALRAQRAGYTQVRWYRGGIQAWQAAGLPVVNRTPVAVIY